MILLGLILLILGLVLNVGILYTIGVVLIVVGAVLWILGAMGRSVGGRAHYYYDQGARASLRVRVSRIRSRHRRRSPATDRSRGPRPRAAARAVAGDGDRASRQPRQGDPVGRQGRRTPGVERVDGVADDGAVVRRPRGARPREREAARVAGPARDQLPAGPAGPRVPDHAAPVRRAPVVPVADQGPRPGRLLDRVGRHRRHRPGVGRARPSLRRRALRRPGRRPPDRPDRRRRARRGRDLGGCRRPDGGQARRGHVGGRPQPPVARPRGAGHRRRAPCRHVRGGRLARRDGQVRIAPEAPDRAACPHRRDAQRGVPAAAAGRRLRAPAPARGRRAARATTPTCWPPSATSAATISAR